MSLTFNQKIQEWVSLDNQIKKMYSDIKALRDKRNTLEKYIMENSENNTCKNSIIKITDGSLKFVNTRVPEPVTFKYLERTMGEIIKNETQVKQIMEHIKNKRNIKIVSEIKRFYT
jgi:hypothetical protein